MAEQQSQLPLKMYAEKKQTFLYSPGNKLSTISLKW